MPDYDLIAILGPTASGKTPFAAALAYELNTEIISGINEGTIVVTEATIGSMPGSGAPDMSQEAPGGEKSPFMPGPPGSKKKSGK